MYTFKASINTRICRTQINEKKNKKKSKKLNTKNQRNEIFMRRLLDDDCSGNAQPIALKFC